MSSDALVERQAAATHGVRIGQPRDTFDTDEVVQHALHQGVVKAVVAGLDRCVRGEATQRPHPRNIVARLAGAPILLRVGIALQQIHTEQCRVAFVHVEVADA